MGGGQHPEWLYDVIWYKMGDKDQLRSVILTMESELSDRSINGIRYDFQKLLVSNAPVKVLFCMCPAKMFPEFTKYKKSVNNGSTRVKT